MNKGEKAYNLFKEGYNCSQAVFGAFAEDLGMNFEDAVRLSSSFGGGMGRLREVCGAVSGMFMVAGAAVGYSDPTNSDAKADHYALIQKMAKKFSDETGSIICRDLLGLEGGSESPVPTPRTDKFYQNRPCGELVRLAAEIAEEILLERSE